jgi:hypothetical protein
MRSLHLLFLLIACLSPMAARADDDREKAKAGDVANMKKIWEALSAYKKAKGEFPPNLHALVPDYLPDVKTLVSPLGPEAEPRAASKEYDEKYPCTYCYEFGTNDFLGRGITFRELKSIQVEEYGLTVPILRCFIYEKTLNISHAGDFFESEFNWESDASLFPLYDKNGLGPGLTKGRKLVVTATDETGKVIPKAQIMAGNRRSFGLSLPIRTFTGDETGKVTIPVGVDENPTADLQADGDWYLSQHWRFAPQPGAPADMSTLTVILKRAGTATGTVRDADGKPLPGALVTVFETADPANPESRRELRSAKTEADGRWKITSVPRGANMLVTITTPNQRTEFIRQSDQPDSVFAALFSGGAEIRLKPPLKVKGVVTAGGKPVGEAAVYLLAPTARAFWSARTDAEGRFEVGAADPGKTYFVVMSKNWAPLKQEVVIATEMEPVALTLEAGRKLKGRVVQGKRTGLPNVPVLFMNFQNNRGHRLPEMNVIGTTDEEGNFVWEHAPKARVFCAALLPSGEHSWFEWNAMVDTDTVFPIEE